FRYVKTNDVVMLLLLLALVPMFFGNPYQSLIPLFAADVLKVGAQETGILLAATGIGSVASLVLMAALPPFKSRGRVLIVTGRALRRGDCRVRGCARLRSVRRDAAAG